MQPEQFNKQYDRWGVPRPSHAPHGSPDDIRGKLEAPKVTRWWQEGNILFAETQHGIVRNTIPTDTICLGMDEKGLPIFKKIGIN